jgi:hypothetical protein
VLKNKSGGGKKMIADYAFYVSQGYDLIPETDFSRCAVFAENYLNARCRDVINGAGTLTDKELARLKLAVCETADAYLPYFRAIRETAANPFMSSEKIGNYSRTAAHGAISARALALDDNVRKRIKGLIPPRFTYAGADCV